MRTRPKAFEEIKALVPLRLLQGTVGNIIQNIMDDTPFDPREGIIHRSEGFDLLPSNILLLQYLNMVKRDYDYVLIDCPRRSGY